jgi:hypothetical protein
VPAQDRGTHARITLGGVSQDVAVTRVGGEAMLPTALAVLRPEALDIGNDGAGWPGTIAARRFAGAVMAYTVDVAGVNLEILTASRAGAVGDAVTVTVHREPVALVSA